MRWLTVRLIVAAFGVATQGVPARGDGSKSAAPAASRGRQAENGWRYVWHNDRWWYWTADERWSSFDGRRWTTYDPRQPSASALASRYRKSPAFERPPAAPPRLPVSEPVDVGRFDAEADANTSVLPAPFWFDKRPGGQLTSPLRDEIPAARNRLEGANRNGLPGNGRRRVDSRNSQGGGGFGGPAGGSFGAGSAVGGASTPQ